MLDPLTAPFQAPFMQKALLEVVLLAVPAGVLGTWIVLRRLAFLTHATGAATFPGLVLGLGLGFAPALGALAVIVVFVLCQEELERRTPLETGVVTGVLLAAALAAGSVLTSDVFHSSGRVDGLLFGSLLGVDGGDLARAATLAVAVAAFAALATRALVAVSFSPAFGAALGVRRRGVELALYAVLAGSVVVTASAIGGFVVSGLLVVPAATARLVARRLRPTQVVATAIAALEGATGLWLAFRFDVPPGAAIAVLAAAVYLAVAAARLVVVRAGAREPLPA